MIQLKNIISVILICIATITGFSRTDSTYIYLGATNNGTSGLLMKQNQSPQEKDWENNGIERRITSSDFGAWGSGKKMYNPRLFRDSIDNSWHLIFDTDKEGTTSCYTRSNDLINWTVQEYRYPTEIRAMVPETAIEGVVASIPLNDNPAVGSIFKVENSVVEIVRSYQNYTRNNDARNNESTSEDKWRFAGIDTVNMTLRPNFEKSKKISNRFIGIFFEDINYAADGGLYAELIQNRDFEYTPTDRGNDLKWNATHSWSLSDSTRLSASIETSNPLSNENNHYIRLSSPGSTKYSLINNGFDGISVTKGQMYNVSLWARCENKTTIYVSLINEYNKTIGYCSFPVKETGEWINLEGMILAKQDCKKSTLSIYTSKQAVVDLDIVSLMPTETFKGHRNGLRQDLAQTLADLKPRFIRFPGGCVAHGDGIDNIYDWKGSIGPLHKRTGKRNLWGYHQTRGLGFHEYFQFCEDINAAPLPVLAAGVPCQNSSTHSHVSHDVLTSNGQQCGIPMDEMPNYINDILDLIEYANGDISTVWGQKRAENGHPEPFNLKMIGIGNEDLITEAFKERFMMIFKAIKDKYPEIEVIGTVGPFYEGSDYEAGWALARKNNIPVVDEHYYVSPGWFIHNGDYYDSYDRNGTKVYLGEYASHVPSRASSLEAALSTALYLTNVERNADVVTMTSYAPLLAKDGHTQWRPDLIYFNNNEIRLTPDYYVQKMYGNNAGNTYIPIERNISHSNNDLYVRLGQSMVIDEQTGDIILRLVNMTPAIIRTNTGIKGNATVTILTGEPDDTDTVEQTSNKSINEIYEQPPYSFSILRFQKN